MVGFLKNPTSAIEGAKEEEDGKLQTFSDSKKLSDPLDLSLPEIEDSFFDFDSIGDWYSEGNFDPKMADLGGNPVDFSSIEVELGACTDIFEVVGGGDVLIEKNKVLEELGGEKVASLSGLGQENGVNEKIRVSGGEGSEGKLGDLGCLIEQKLEKVSLDGDENSRASVVVNSGNDVIGVNNGNGMLKADKTASSSDEDESGSDEDDSSSSSSSSSSSTSSSSSSSDDEEEDEDSGEKKSKKGKGVVEEESEKEEGEILLSDDADEMVTWSDNEEDGIGSGTLGPIMSKNELKVLPPVPSVSVTLEPHHQPLPVGIILSVVGPQVIVEGVEKHNPLNEGSILWITESRSPLGIIDEIFGPVKNPYYIVRYNDESEVPDGIQQGTFISFVPEFAQHVLNEKSLYQKGYDASGENDEELSDELEFSDDEKEAEYRRMLKMKKRGGTNDSNNNNKPARKRNNKKKNENWNRNRDAPAQTPLGGDKSPVTKDQQLVQHVATSSNQESNFRQDLAVNQGATVPQFPHSPTVPPFPQFPQGPGFGAPNVIWNNGLPHQQQHHHHHQNIPHQQQQQHQNIPHQQQLQQHQNIPHQQQQQQQQNIGLPNGLPGNGMMWMQQNLPYQLYQTQLQNNMAFQQQMMSTIPGFPLNFNPFVGQANFGGTLNQPPFGMAFQAQPAAPIMPMNGGGGEQPLQSQGSQINPNFQQSPSASPFNQGRGGGGGRGHHRGGRFGGGRGRFQSR